MRVCELIPVLADLVEQSELPRSAMQQQRIAHLRAIVDYEKRVQLSEWEKNIPEVSDKDDLETGNLLEAIIDVATYNMYGKFDPEGTLQEYLVAERKLSEAGLTPPRVDHIDDW